MSPDTSRFIPARGAFRNTLRFLVCALVPAFVAAAGTAPLGSAQFAPSPESPLGWRGDGTGRFPGATGPTVWERKAGADGYTTKGIVWMAPLPNIGVGSPIVVGDRIFLTAEVQDLICLEKKTGRILWIRSDN